MDKARLLLTKLWLGGKGKYLRVEPITLPWGETKEIVVFTSKRLSLPGQATPFGTVIIHDKILGQPELKDHVSVHEFTHLRQWYAFPLEIIGLICYLTSFLMLISTLSCTTSLIIELDYLHMNENIIKIFTIAMTAFLGLIAFWFVEYKADCSAIRELGTSKVLAARAKWETMSERNLADRIISFLTHPPIKLTVRLCLFFNRQLRRQNDKSSIG